MVIPMSKPFQTPEFKKLFKEWNEKLKESGFEEIENFNLPEPTLIDWHALRFKKIQGDEISLAGKYFELALNVLRTHEFETGTHRLIWELHCHGKSIREISGIVNLNRFRRDMVHTFIIEMQALHGLKKR